MLFITLFFILLDLFQAATSLSIPIPNPTRARSPRLQPARVVNAPAIPTSTLVSDFKKNNVSSQWAPGHPLQWGSEEKLIEFPVPLGFVGWVATAVTEDEKFLIMIASQVMKVYDLDKEAFISNSSFNFPADEVSLVLLTAPGGGYDLIMSAENYTTRIDKTIQVRLDQNGKRTNYTREFEGKFASFEDRPFSKDGRKMLTQSQSTYKKGVAYVYNLDDPTFNLTLSGHEDWIMSETFSPDGKMISTASWDGTAKLWDASTGQLLHTLGPFGGQNWLTRFSPDGKNVLVSIGPGAKPVIAIWDLNKNLTNDPQISIGPFPNWCRSAEWTSDSSLLATGDYGHILIYDMSSHQILQNWEMEDRWNWEISNMAWLEGKKQITYRITGGLELYDFETNLKYRWGPGDMDRYNGGSGPTFLLKKKGWIGGVEADVKVRFWKYTP